MSEDEHRQDSGLSTADVAGMQSQAAQQPNGDNGATTAATARPYGNGRTTPPVEGAGTSDQANATPLLTSDDSAQFRSRWEDIQAGFVDEPRQAVEQADHLVAEVIKRVAELFAQERQGLEAQWKSGGDVDTEALRIALKRYRSFFDRLLTSQG
ncbi:MAG TPA: hypothetical protein VFA70_05045 [Dehalococcoidia bacterium]|jgi:hypothetical protein|nr:hypothetical protein [Dehalococcoidia bacterium]